MLLYEINSPFTYRAAYRQNVVQTYGIKLISNEGLSQFNCTVEMYSISRMCWICLKSWNGNNDQQSASQEP